MTCRAMSKDDALAELEQLAADQVILLEGVSSSAHVSLDGWNPSTFEKENGNVAGVVIRYLGSGRRHGLEPASDVSGGAAPDLLDPRNALALVRLCQWLSGTWGVTELYHAGISGGGVDKHGNARVDCHGQGRAVDFVGVRGAWSDGSPFLFTVFEDWGDVATDATPGGEWPAGAATAYRLDSAAHVETQPGAADFFRDLYAFVAAEWQDRSSHPDGTDVAPTSIGESSFIMSPDHPTSAPGTAHGREAHRGHLHFQIGVTGTES